MTTRLSTRAHTATRRAALAVLLLALLLAGCNSSPDRLFSSTAEEPTPTATPQPTATETPAGSRIPQTPLPTAQTPSAQSPPAPIALAELPAPLYFLSDGQIQRLERDGVSLSQVTSESQPVTGFDVSPVTERVVYVSGNDLIEADPAQGTRTVLVDGEPIEPGDAADFFTRQISDPLYAPDGSRIAFGLGGVNLIAPDAPEDIQKILPSDPYPDPSDPPRTVVRFFRPADWSPDGSTLLVAFSYWPEAGGLTLLDVESGALTELSGDTPDTVLCCDWAWAPGGSQAFIASNLLAYGFPGLSRVDVDSGRVRPLLSGLPPQRTPDAPVRLFFSAFAESPDALLTFISTQESSTEGIDTAESGYRMSRVALPESSAGDAQPKEIRQESFADPVEILWARDGSGAVLADPGEFGPSARRGNLIWLPLDGSPPLALPAVGSHLRWGWMPGTAPAVAQADTTPTPDSSGATPEATSEATPDATPDPDAPPAPDGPSVTALTLLNLRSGPGTAYPIVGELAEGQTATVTGISADGQWWQIDLPQANDQQAWVIGDPLLAEAQNTGAVAVAQAPPLPVPPGRLYFPLPNATGSTDIYSQAPLPGAAQSLVLAEASQPRLFTDGRRLAVRSLRSDLLGIGVYDLVDKNLLGLSSHVEDGLPSWNPAGDRLVFASTRHGDRRWRVYTTSALVEETAQELSFGLDPDWHPSVDRIVFKGCDVRGENCGLWTMNSDGSDPRQLTDNKSDSRPRWTPDGSAVIFMSESRDGNWELYIASAANGSVARLTTDGANDGLPAISPDGSRVAFVSNRNGQWAVWSVPVSGGAAQQLAPIGPDLPNWLEQSIDWAR